MLMAQGMKTYDISDGVRYKDVKAAVQTLVTAGTKSITIGYKFMLSNSPAASGLEQKAHIWTLPTTVLLSATPRLTQMYSTDNGYGKPHQHWQKQTASCPGAVPETEQTIPSTAMIYHNTSATSGFSFRLPQLHPQRDILRHKRRKNLLQNRGKGNGWFKLLQRYVQQIRDLDNDLDDHAPNSVTGPTNVVMNTSNYFWGGAPGDQ